MTEKDLQTLRDHYDQVVRITTRDGEVMLAKVLFISETEGDLSYDLISTSREAQYEKHDEQPVYLIPFRDIDCVEAVARGQSS
jgi:hypothetical protein